MDNNTLDLITPGRPDRWTDEDHGTRDLFSVPVTFATTTAEAIEIINTLGPGVVAMDTETVRAEKVDPFTAELRVISIATEDAAGNDVSYVFDVKDMDRAALGEAFQDRAKQLGIPRLRMVGFNANFDDPVTTINLETWSKQSGKTYRHLFDWTDLMFAVSLMRLGAAGNSWWGLARATKQFLGLELDGKGSVQLSYDADTPLTDDQIRYAANDAIATLWLGDALTDPVRRLKLNEVFTLECGARPFLLAMTVHGLPFNEKDWMGHVKDSAVRKRAIEGEIAALVGGQPDLWGNQILEYSLGSPVDLRKLLNTEYPELVQAFLNIHGKRGATALTDSDSVDKETLGLMKVASQAVELDTTILDLLLEHSTLAKLESTYGDKMMAMLGDDGRFHSNFIQCQIETGRTSSRSPNAQNFAPSMKPFFNPTPRVDENGVEHERVILHADYSQAEMRTSAQLTGETVRKMAFVAGEDQHEAVAAKMFNVDMLELKMGDASQKARYKYFRSSAKPLNFGLAYGLRAPRLARQLTLQGVPTTTEEAAKLIDDYYKALPAESKWLEKRDKYVENLAESVSYGLEPGTLISFDLTMRLYRAKARIKEAARQITEKALKRDPEALFQQIFQEGTALSGDTTPRMSDQDKEQWIAQIAWALSYDAAVVLRADGAPWEFYSRTLAGRRRIFQVSTEAFLDELATALASPRSVQNEVKVDAWGRAHNMTFAKNPHPAGGMSPNRKSLGFMQLRKLLNKDKPLRAKFAMDMLADLRNKEYFPRGRRVAMGHADFLERAAMTKCIQRLANAYRNAPIQGTVADGAMLAFSRLDELLDEYPTAYPITTVHDSIAIEVDKEDAEELAKKMHQTMVDSLARYVPDIPIVVDLDILSSLSEDDIVEFPTAA